MRSTNQPKKNSNPMLTFPSFDINLYQAIDFIKKNEVKNGIDCLMKCSDLKVLETLQPQLQDIVKNNFFLHIQKLANRNLETKSELNVGNLEFDFLYGFYTKLTKNKNELAKALHIKFTYNFDSDYYEIALATINEIIALDPTPEYYHARVRTYHAMGSYALALEDAKLAKLSGMDNESHERMLKNLKKKLEASIKEEPVVRNALQLLAQNKAEAGINLIKHLLPFKTKDKIHYKENLGENIISDAIKNIMDYLVEQWFEFEKTQSAEIANQIISGATIILNLSDHSSECANAHRFLGEVFYKQKNFYKSLDHFKKVLEIQPNDDSTQITISSINKKMTEYYFSQFYQPEEKKLDTSKKKKKKKKKKPEESSKKIIKVNHVAEQLKEKLITHSPFILPAIKENNKEEFEDKIRFINKVFSEAKEIQHNHEIESKKFNESLISYFNKLFSEMCLTLQHLEKKDENSASIFYQNLLTLTPLNNNMKTQITSLLRKLDKKNHKKCEEPKKDDDSDDILDKISYLPKAVEFDLAVEELRCELTPDQYHESNPENIEKIYETYQKIDLVTIAIELQKKLDEAKSRNLKKTLLTKQKELARKIQQQKEIKEFYEKIKEINQHQALIKESLVQQELLCLTNQHLTQEILALKNLSLHHPENAKAKLVVIQNEIKNNTEKISQLNMTISTNLTKPLASLQLSTLKRNFENNINSLEHDKKNYIEAKLAVEQNIQMLENEESCLQALIIKAKLLCESKNKANTLKTKIENLQKIHHEIETLHSKLQIYPYFATHCVTQDALTDIHQTLQNTQTLFHTYEILIKTDAIITLDEKVSLSEKYNVIWKGGVAQLVGAMLYTDCKIAEKVVIKDADSLILDESPSSTSAKLITEDKYQSNNPKSKKSNNQFYKPPALNYIQLKKIISVIKDDKPLDKEIDLTIGDKKTYTEKFITGFAAGRLIIVPSHINIEEKNYDIVHLVNHKLCIDKTYPFYADFKFAFTDKTYLVTSPDKDHRNHSYVVVKNYKKMVNLFGKENVDIKADDRLAGDGQTNLISYHKYLTELYTVFSKQYSWNFNACYQEVNSLVINYGFKDPDIKPFLEALIQVKMEQDVRIKSTVSEIKDTKNFIEEVILHLCTHYSDISKIKDFNAEKLNKNCISPAILHIVKQRIIKFENPGKHRINSGTTNKYLA